MGKAKSAKSEGFRGSPYERAKPKKNNVFKFNTNLGQHILKNPTVAEHMVLKADLKPTDVVLEVGPGTGNLTVRILEKAKKVIAVELDPRMAAEVTKRVQGTPEQKKLEVLLGDVIKTDLPPFDVCISNTPYKISSPLIFKLLSMPNPPRVSLLMLQREFALRLLAQPGDTLYCRLSVNAQFFAKVSHVMKVGKNNFKPPPQVESSVVRIEIKSASDRPNVSWDEFDGLLRVCFNRRHRTLRASFLGQKEVLSMIEKNYRVYCALNNIPVDESIIEDDDDNDDDGRTEPKLSDDMDVDTWEQADQKPIYEEDDDDVPEFIKEMEAEEHKYPAATPSKKKKTAVAKLVREKVRKVLLEETGLGDKRPAVCDENDFLKLLYAFNKEGIHFS